MDEKLIDTNETDELSGSKLPLQKFDQRSDLAQEMISKNPGFVERWALYIFLVILLLMLLACWFIKYPDIIECRTVLISPDSDMEVAAGQSGRLGHLFVHNNDPVSKNQLLGWLESTANPQEIIKFNRQLDSGIYLLNTNKLPATSTFINHRFDNLGELEPAYQRVLIAWQLFSKQVQHGHNPAMQKTVFGQTLISVKKQVNDWLNKYALRSPANGSLYFTTPLHQNQQLQAGKIIGYVSDANKHFYAQAYLPQLNFGKIKVNAPVQLRFEAYPYQEWGYIEGQIDYLSAVPSDSGFFVAIRLTKGHVTNNNRVIPFANGLKADAIIITNNSRLTDRMFYNIIKITSAGNK